MGNETDDDAAPAEPATGAGDEAGDPAAAGAVSGSADGASAPIRVRGRSFIALVLTPSAPLDRWIDALDGAIGRAGAFFTARPVLLDLGLLEAGTPGLDRLPERLRERGVRVIATENGAVADDLAGFPPTLGGGRPTGDEAVPEVGDGIPSPAADVDVAPPVRSMVVTEPVRSGSQIIFAEGDLTILGSVASGAEVLAGGTIHVYGALRGRAIAGFGGRPDARVFCRRMEAELVAIDGYYLTAEDMDATISGRPAQVFLDGEEIRLRPLD